MSVDRVAANAIMMRLVELCEEKRIAHEIAVAAVESATTNCDRHNTRYDRNVAHGEHIGAIEALYAARAVFNDNFGVVSFTETAHHNNNPDQQS